MVWLPNITKSPTHITKLPEMTLWKNPFFPCAAGFVGIGYKTFQLIWRKYCFKTTPFYQVDILLASNRWYVWKSIRTKSILSRTTTVIGLQKMPWEQKPQQISRLGIEVAKNDSRCFTNTYPTCRFRELSRPFVLYSYRCLPILQFQKFAKNLETYE